MPMCQAFGCNNQPSKSNNLAFFPIPDPGKDPERCRSWLHQIGTDKFHFRSYKFNKNRVVCEEHFEESCFEVDMSAALGLKPFRRKLKPDAVPTIFVHKKASTSRDSSRRRSDVAERMQVLDELINPPEYASAEASEGESIASIVEEEMLPEVSQTLEVSTQPPKRVLSPRPHKFVKQKRRRRVSSKCLRKEVMVQTNVQMVEAFTQTEPIMDHSDAGTQYPEADVQPTCDEPTLDHSYCLVQDPSDVEINLVQEVSSTEMEITASPETLETFQQRTTPQVSPSMSSDVKPSPVKKSSSSLESNDSDVSYHPFSEQTSSEDDDEREPTTEERCVLQRKFLVYEEMLDLLLFNVRCPRCFGRVVEMEKYDNLGTMLRVKLQCANGHLMMEWASQPLVGSVPAGNIMVSAATLLSGNTFSKISQFAEFLGLHFIGKTTYYGIQKNLLHPIINDAFQIQQNGIISELKGKEVELSGDGRCDSPGYNAKYCAYTMMDMASGKIVWSELVQVTETTSSVAMEKVGFQRCLEHISGKGVQVKVVATDRHTGITSMMKKEFSSIDHQYDVWHLAKSVKKKTCCEVQEEVL